jgi:Flp pilus assembly pilin Flp
VGHNAQEEHTMLALYLRIRNLFVREDGQDLIEYALLVAFIALVAVIGVTTAGESIMDLLNNVAGELDGFVTP